MRSFEAKYLRLNNFDEEILIKPEVIEGSITHLYSVLDVIDTNLECNGANSLSNLIEKANLSSLIGNVLGTACEKYSNGDYYRNEPNTYPDLLSANGGEGIEIKTAIGRNAPKGHHIKPGNYLIYRYSLTGKNGILQIGNNSQNTVTIWEVKFGYLYEDDFTYSDTKNDSGKTATIKLSSLDNLNLLYFDPMACPYKHHSLMNPYSGYN